MGNKWRVCWLYSAYPNVCRYERYTQISFVNTETSKVNYFESGNWFIDYTVSFDVDR